MHSNTWEKNPRFYSNLAIRRKSPSPRHKSKLCLTNDLTVYRSEHILYDKWLLEYVPAMALGQWSSKRPRRETRKVARSKWENSQTNKWLVFQVKAILTIAYGPAAVLCCNMKLKMRSRNRCWARMASGKLRLVVFVFLVPRRPSLFYDSARGVVGLYDGALQPVLPTTPRAPCLPALSRQVSGC